MKKIYKYELEPIGEQSIKMPRDSYVISVIEQGGKIIVYAVVDVDVEEVDKNFAVLGTGWAVPDIVYESYLLRATVKVGKSVWHVWESFD